MKFSIRTAVIISILSFIFLSCASEDIAPAGTPLKIAVCTDIHYLSESLRDDGVAFREFNESGDGKLLHYGSELIEAFIADLVSSEVDILIVSGDLTVNGEKDSHKDLADYFSTIERAGTRVLVIPGNHDINNPYALGFKDDERYFTDSITPKDFSRIYGSFGYKKSSLRDPDSLSYLAKASENLWFLMLDSNKYENNYKFNAPFAGGTLRSATLEWLDEVAAERDKAEVPVNIISVTHHNLLPHNEMFADGFTLDNFRDAQKKLYDLGVKLNLSGHMHIQDIIYSWDSDIYDIATGSFSVYPQQYGLITTDGEEMNYATEWVNVETWATAVGSDDHNLLDFRNYSDRAFREQSEQKFSGRMIDGYSPEEAELLLSTMSSLNSRYFAGTDSIDKERILSSEGFKLWEEADDSFARTYIMTMIEDKSDDNSLNLKFR